MVFFIQIEKTYFAVVANHVKSKFQVVSAPLRPDPSRPLHQVLISAEAVSPNRMSPHPYDLMNAIVLYLL